MEDTLVSVAIHNKNGQGLLPILEFVIFFAQNQSQSTIKMDKGYYRRLQALGGQHEGRNPQ